MNNYREKYEALMTRDYSFYTVFPDSGEVHCSTIDLSSDDDPVTTFNECMADWIVTLIGKLTIYGFSDCELYWCHDRSKKEYFGGKRCESMDQLVHFYRWWMNNEY